MHHCMIQIGDGSAVKLTARPEPRTKQINVNAPVPLTQPERGGAVDVVCSIFTAELDPAIHCQEKLATTHNWDFEIELAPDKRLSEL
jgi:hypothetical protein